MRHFAKVEDEIVTQVICADQNFIDTQEGTWVETYFNTVGGIHLGLAVWEDQDQIVGLRKNFAAVGFTYDAARDAFIPPKPYPSFVLNEDTCLWESHIPYPTDGKAYNWNEDSQQWDEIGLLY